MAKKLPQSFFNRDTLVVARELLGKTLVRRLPDGTVVRLPITETEAYIGEEDLACHASKGRTGRTEVMFGKPGVMYIYLIYGMYYMLNIVTEEMGHASAVLIRGVGEYSGPGKLTKALSITNDLNGEPLGKASGLWIEEGIEVRAEDILATPRIGVSYAGEWADKPYRFLLKKE